ncbi:isoprenylcysteine carboxylmethyltransferase family protein [Zoogloea sp.]|uniref:methyltransferase family protein n=1 Tax=Zoogloea sp. TaxID=49181 RepID=UPI0035AE9972
MSDSDLPHLLLLAVGWLLFGALHSLLAGTTLERLFGRHARLAFNVLAVVTVAAPLAILASLPATPLFDEPAWLRHGLGAAAVLGFIHTLKFYSMSAFLGLRQETWPLTFSPWHCRVRHPWYFLMLVFIWTRQMSAPWLVSALCISAYLVIGSRLEEKRILRRHPGSYAAYRRIVPGLIPWRGRALDEAARRRLEAQALEEN